MSGYSNGLMLVTHIHTYKNTHLYVLELDLAEHVFEVCYSNCIVSTSQHVDIEVGSAGAWIQTQ